MTVGILTDLTLCVGCEACVTACRQSNGLTEKPRTEELSESTWTTIRWQDGTPIRRQCMHCQEPACASACPVGAMKKQPEGAVIWDEDLCMGCRYCMIACPFQVPTYEWSESIPAVRKCIMCYDERMQKGLEPGCTSACPTGATIFGERDELFMIAEERIAANPDKYVDHIYGAEEAGGTSVIYLSDKPFEELGFSTRVSKKPYPDLSKRVLTNLGALVPSLGAALGGIYWITNRRDEVAEAEGHDHDE